MNEVVVTIERRAEEAERHAAALRKMLAGAQELGDEGIAQLRELITQSNGNGHEAPAAHAEQVHPPRGRKAVRQIVAERPGIWTLSELREEMKRRGWFTSAKAVEVAVARLCDLDREGRRVGKGRYLFPANNGEEGAVESDASGVAVIASS